MIEKYDFFEMMDCKVNKIAMLCMKGSHDEKRQLNDVNLHFLTNYFGLIQL